MAPEGDAGVDAEGGTIATQVARREHRQRMAAFEVARRRRRALPSMAAAVLPPIDVVIEREVIYATDFESATDSDPGGDEAIPWRDPVTKKIRWKTP